MSVLGDGRAHGEVVTNLRHIWRTKFLFANFLDRANCSCLFASTSISPQVSPKTLKHSAKLSQLFSVRSFFPTILVLRKICRRKFTVDEFCEEKLPSVENGEPLLCVANPDEQNVRRGIYRNKILRCTLSSKI